MKPHYIYILAIISCLASCTPHSKHWETLMQVESYIEERPDSALTVLQGMDKTELSGKEEEAKHALLLSMALDKNVIDRTDFEVLQPAIDYYQNHGTATDKLRTHYYEGRIYTNQGDRTSASIRFNQALTLGEESDDIRTKARIHFAQANIYNKLYKFDKYIEENKLAAEYFKEAGLTNSYANCLNRIANGYILSKDEENSLKYIELCRPLLQSLNKNRRNDFYNVYLIYLIEYGSKEEIASILNEYRATNPNGKLDWGIVANAYLKLDNEKEAYSCLLNFQHSSVVNNNARFYAFSTELYQKMNLPEKALEAYQNYINITDSIDLVIYKQNAQFIEEFNKYELETLRSKATQDKIVLGAIAAILSLSFVCLWIYDRYKIHKRETEKYRLLCLQVETERDNLSELLSKQKENLSKDAQDALLERISLLNRFFTAHITNNDTSNSKLHQEMDALIANREIFMDSTRLAFKASHPQFINHLEEHGLTEWEINYCCLYAMGLKGREVGTYIKMRSHYNVSSDIREKLGINEHDTNLGIYLRKLLAHS